MELEEALARVFLFSGLDRKHLRKLAKRMQIIDFASGDEIITEGETGSGGMGVILTGSVQVRHGPQGVLAHLGPGEVFGEMALIDEHPRAATVIAEAPTQAAVLRPEDFVREIQETPAIAIRLIQILVERLREVEALPGFAAATRGTSTE